MGYLTFAERNRSAPQSDTTPTPVHPQVSKQSPAPPFAISVRVVEMIGFSCSCFGWTLACMWPMLMGSQRSASVFMSLICLVLAMAPCLAFKLLLTQPLLLASSILTPQALNPEVRLVGASILINEILMMFRRVPKAEKLSPENQPTPPSNLSEQPKQCSPSASPPPESPPPLSASPPSPPTTKSISQKLTFLRIYAPQIALAPKLDGEVMSAQTRLMSKAKQSVELYGGRIHCDWGSCWAIFGLDEVTAENSPGENTIKHGKPSCLQACHAALHFRQNAVQVRGKGSVFLYGLSVAVCYGDSAIDLQPFPVEIPRGSGNTVLLVSPLFEVAIDLNRLNPILETSILITADVYEAVHDEVACQLVDMVHFNLPDLTPTAVYELISEHDQHIPDPVLTEAFEHFFRGDIRGTIEVLPPLSNCACNATRHYERLGRLTHAYSKPSPALPRPYLRVYEGWQQIEMLADSYLEGAPSRRFSVIPSRSSVTDDFPPTFTPNQGVADIRIRRLMSFASSTQASASTENQKLSGVTEVVSSGESDKSEMDLDDDTSFDSTLEDDDGEPAPVSPIFSDCEGFRWYASKTVVGAGSWGRVHVGMNESGLLVALKQVRVFEADTERAEAMLNEIRLLSQFHHRNIIKYLGSAFVNGHVVIIMEWCAGGSLESLISTFEHLPIVCVARYSRDILKGLIFLHKNNIIHRDVKPRNILVDLEGRCKLADFGTSGKLGNVCKIGTVAYMAPEALKFDWSKASDIWSFGVTLYQMLTRELPWPFAEQSDAVAIGYRIRSNNWDMKPLPDTLPPSATQLVVSCFLVDPVQRPSASQLLNHPFITQHLTPHPVSFSAARPPERLSGGLMRPPPLLKSRSSIHLLPAYGHSQGSHPLPHVSYSEHQQQRPHGYHAPRASRQQQVQDEKSAIRMGMTRASEGHSDNTVTSTSTHLQDEKAPILQNPPPPRSKAQPHISDPHPHIPPLAQPRRHSPLMLQPSSLLPSHPQLCAQSPATAATSSRQQSSGGSVFGKKSTPRSAPAAVAPAEVTATSSASTTASHSSIKSIPEASSSSPSSSGRT